MWTHKATKLLIEIFRQKKEMFEDPTKRKKNIWASIAEEMQENGFDVTEETLDRKWRNLKSTYTVIKEKQRASEQGIRKRNVRLTWSYYNDFEEIYRDDKHINPEPTISSFDYVGLDTSMSDLKSPEITASPETPTDEPETEAFFGVTDPVDAKPSVAVKRKIESKTSSKVRKMLLEVEEAKVEALKEISVQMRENNKIQRRKNELLEKILDVMANSMSSDQK